MTVRVRPMPTLAAVSFFQVLAAADAVRRQAYGALERTHRVFRAAAEDAVQRRLV